MQNPSLVNDLMTIIHGLCTILNDTSFHHDKNHSPLSQVVSNGPLVEQLSLHQVLGNLLGGFPQDIVGL